MVEPQTLVIYSFVFALSVCYLHYRRRSNFSTPQQATATANANASQGQGSSSQNQADAKQQKTTIMQPARDDLAPPKDDPITTEELKQYDGSQAGKPIYVAIKGVVFDVSRKADVYGPGKSYNIFAGKDGSKGLGMSSLKTDDAVPDYSTLDEKDRKVLEDWYTFFEKRYNIVGKVSDGPKLD